MRFDRLLETATIVTNHIYTGMSRNTDRFSIEKGRLHPIIDVEGKGGGVKHPYNWLKHIFMYLLDYTPPLKKLYPSFYPPLLLFMENNIGYPHPFPCLEIEKQEYVNT